MSSVQFLTPRTTSCHINTALTQCTATGTLSASRLIQDVWVGKTRTTTPVAGEYAREWSVHSMSHVRSWRHTDAMTRCQCTHVVHPMFMPCSALTIASWSIVDPGTGAIRYVCMPRMPMCCMYLCFAHAMLHTSHPHPFHPMSCVAPVPLLPPSTARPPRSPPPSSPHVHVPTHY